MTEPDSTRLTGSSDLEHRIQLWDLRQTHELPRPTASGAVGAFLGMLTEPARQLEQRLGEVRSVVRDVHERLYQTDSGRWSDLRARLGMEQAALRLEALGFNDVAAAKRALEDLTAGLSRRSQAMQQVLL